MTKLCPRGKAAAKRKFKVYPSAYANAYASKICAGKIKDPSGTKRKDWGPKKAKVGMAVSAGSQSALGRLQKSGIKAKSGTMVKKKLVKGKDYDMTSDELIALVESVNDPNPKKKDRIYSSGNKMKIKRSKENIDRYNKGGMARGMGAAVKGGKFQGTF